MAKFHINNRKSIKAARKQGRKLLIAAEKDHRRMIDTFEQLSPVDRHRIFKKASKKAVGGGIANVLNMISIAYGYAKQITNTIEV